MVAALLLSAAQPAVVIQPLFKRGDTRTYVSAGAFTFELATRIHTDKAYALLEEAVVLVRGDHSFVLRHKKTITLTVFDGKPYPPKSKETETRTVSYLPNGELDEEASWMQVSLRTARPIEFVYPPGPVKPGDTWKWTRPHHPRAGSPECEKTFTYRGTEVHVKENAHKVDFHFIENRKMPITLDGTAWLSTKDGHVIEWSADAKNFPYLATGTLLCTAKLSVVERKQPSLGKATAVRR